MSATRQTRGRAVFLPILLMAFSFCLAAAEVVSPAWSFLIGTDTGLYSLDHLGRLQALKTGLEVQKIIRRPSGWVIQSGEGVFVSEDLLNFEARNTGLPVKTIKLMKDGKKTLLSSVQGMKDLEVSRQNPEVMVCAFREGIYLSRNSGLTWAALGMPAYRTNGFKAVAAAFLPGSPGGAEELTVFCSHSVYGIHYLQPDRKGAKWTELNGGIEKLATTDNPDEISDIVLVPGPGEKPLLCVSMTFHEKLYRLDWEGKRFLPLWTGAAGFGPTDSLSPGRDSLRFLREGQVMELAYPLDGPGSPQRPVRERSDLREFITGIPRNLGLVPTCIIVSEDLTRSDAEVFSLSELWLLNLPSGKEKTEGPASGREGLYLPVNHAAESKTLAPYLAIIKERNLNMVVIDMKDDWGRLRFTPKNAELTKWGRVFRPINLESFLGEMKERGVYTVARVVVFKDPEAAKKDGGKYAVWDAKEKAPWVGYYLNKEGEKEYIDERWVDPYAEQIWDYTASLSAELQDQGFDEIQFDYIRFPTDGSNLGDARYRFKDQGMDMDSAIVSLLTTVRSRVSIPLSVDIYGANGWYRTSARTGQDVELLSHLVDVICPMYYPSHFEQDFLAQPPPEERPYRIYFLGANRTRVIARNQVVVRPYAQAFYLNVSYDRKYYNPDYVRRELEGVRAAGNGGLTYWNNSGRYDDIPQTP